MRPFFVAILALMLVSPTTVPAQTDTAGSVAVGGFAAYGSGPSPSAAWGLHLAVPLGSSISGLRAEVSGWRSGIASACIQRWPDSYRCGVEGWAALAGATLRPGGRIRPYADVLVGVYSRAPSPVGDRRVLSVAAVAGAGVEIRLAAPLSLEAGGRYLRPFDEDYRTLMDEPLRYLVGTVGITYRVGG